MLKHILKIFNNDLHFYTKRRKTGGSNNPFDLDFDDINAYGEKVESLRECSSASNL